MAISVSVIMPVYNTESYLAQAIESVVNQFFTNWELIVVDDGSTDGSLNILHQFAREDSRIRIITQKNEGQSSARNKGLELAKGRYVYFMDSDDILKKQTLGNCIAHCEDNDLDFIFFDAEVFYDLNDDLSHSFEYTHTYCASCSCTSGVNSLYHQLQHDEYNVSPCLLFISKRFLNKNIILFKEGILHEDELFTTTLYLHATKVSYLEEVLYTRRVRSDSTMTTRFKRRNIDSYFVVAQEIKKLRCISENHGVAIDLYLQKMLNAALWKAHVLPFKDRLELVRLALTQWLDYVRVGTFVSLLLKKYINKR